MFIQFKTHLINNKKIINQNHKLSFLNSISFKLTYVKR
jgi:hypothetical protein